MRFYAVSTEAIQHTARALQQLEQRRQGSPRRSRALRVAQLYGHLQCRARDGRAVELGLRELAAAWALQPRELRADLQDLQSLGWLHYSSSARGICVQLADAVGSAAAIGPQPATEPTPEPTPQLTASAADQALIARFAEHYNRHRPQAWPAYSPRGTALAARLRRVVRHAGGAEAFWPVLARALQSMPDFWRNTYPRGRSGADCAAALLSADRRAAGLGVEFWHVLAWGADAPQPCGGSGGQPAGAGDGAAAGLQESDLEKARRLLFWCRDHWHGTGIEAAKLDRREKQRLAELLEAQGDGRPGTAAEQFSQPARQH